MNITKESTGELTATLKLDLNSADYQEKIDKNLKDYQKKASMPGFRPGKVPYGMVKKMYGKAVLLDEINKMVSESLTNYIKENNLNLLGEPLPNNEKQPQLNFDEPKDFEFYFDIAFAPEIAIELSEKIKLDYYNIEADSKIVDGYLGDLRRRYGQIQTPDISMDEDMINGKFVELDENGTIKEGGLTNTFWISLTHIKDQSVKAKLIGVKKDDQVVFNPLKATENKVETAAMLGLKSDEIGDSVPDVQFTVHSISRVELAAMNEDLYKKVYPNDDIKTEEEFIVKIKTEVSASYVKQSDGKLMNDAIKYFLKEVKVDFPEDFLKRFLLESNKEITQEHIDKEFDQYMDSLKWQLVENKIIADGKINVSPDEVKEYYKNYVRNMFVQYGGNGEDQAQLEQRAEEIATKALQNKEETQKIFHSLYDEKIIQYIKSKIKLVEKNITFEEFSKLVSEK